MSLIRSAPPWRIRADPLAHLVDASRRRRSAGRGHAASTSGASPRDVAAAAGAGDVGAGALHPRARQPAGVDGVAQRDVDERAIGADVADGREAGPQRVARVADAGHRLLGAGAGQHLGVAVPMSMSPTRWAWQSMSPGRRVWPGRSRTLATSVGHVGRRDHAGDALVLDDHGAVRQELAGRRRRGADRGAGRVGPSRPDSIGVSPTSFAESAWVDSASGAPSQQLAFMWQCGHNQRVPIGSNSSPQ